MAADGFFQQTFVYLSAAVVAVPIAKRLGLGSVLGYLLAGVAIGPFGLHLVGDSTKDVMHFAEFGVVMMLFLVGLELQPSLLWKLRGPIFGWGSLQVVGTALAGGCVGAAFGLDFGTAFAAGLILAMSSTAIVLQVLQEKGWLKSPGGQSSFAVLLFQDISVIPILAFLPLLGKKVADANIAASEAHGQAGAQSGWIQALLILLVVAAIVVAGRYLLRPLFRFIAHSGLREMFTATALLIVVGISLAVQAVGLSPALGTFLAGVVLADSEYRHELEGDIEPFKGLLLGLFFISVGAGIDFSLIARNPGLIALGTTGLIALKFAVLFGVSRVFKLPIGQGLLFALGLAQGGEFCFVLLSFAEQNRVLDATFSATAVSVVALSMAVTPLLFIVYEKVILPRFAAARETREPDEIDEKENPVILAGFGRFGHVIGRLMSAAGVRSTVLDTDSDQVELARKIGLKVFYGDASRLDLLHSAGASRAKLFVVAVDDEHKITEIVQLVQKHFPQLTIMARANSRTHEYELLRLGVKYVYRETMGSSMELGTDLLRQLGFRAFEAHRIARAFRQVDRDAVFELLKYWGKDEKAYISTLRDRVSAMNEIFARERQAMRQRVDHAWDTDTIREEIAQRTAAEKQSQ
jgi:monovalent cation:proton antiporter-2 (CPA2) family protein